MWYQSGTSTRRNTCHTNVGDLPGLCGGRPACTTVWGKRTLRCKEMSRSKERASRFGIRGMVNPLRKRHHEDNGPLGERWDRAKWEVLRNDRKSCAKLTEVRGIVNSKDSELMQGLILGRRSVHGYPKVTSELSAMGHQNFLFDMKRICP
ncbi:hypothetical protein BHM03_00025032 [Ensete ventricosum]|nr:hypothetical protein BHM03_00025032 [Ensete ventricosum]